MANLSEDMVWKDGIYQLETTDPVVGGPEGIDNRQAKELASRTQYLKAQVELRATTVTVNALIAAAVDSILGSTPETLDTLNELAAALGDDPNFAATLTALIGTKLDTSSFTGTSILALLVAVHGAGSGLDADRLDGQQGSHYAPKASPALTGSPTAPTAVAGNSTNQIASTEFVQTEISNGLGSIDLSLYAPKASPALTGAPTAPTQVPGTNDTTLATTSFIQAALATLVASSPGTLDTLNELAAALGDDPNFATTMTALIGTKLNSSAFTASAIKTLLKTVDGAGSGIDADKLDGVQGNSYARKESPALTGNPTAPTQDMGDNSTKIATTEYVERAVAAAPSPVKAWVNFNGTGVVAIRNSFNVLGVTDLGRGLYRVTFATEAANANYAAVVNSGPDDSNTSGATNHYSFGYTTASFDIRILDNDSPNTRDVTRVLASVFGSE